ncbi:hypothetical protein CGCF415_v010604 [Colletotrichum fructicola]|uniref:SnoaL-like domain-containing protein n=1 Tax=Colletotrichum fructicola (strain Nara gc5) TaxID=1213859 RepID=L2FWS5_COLFN|nr:uncharacterized protein CGMCC3_g15145 [Colletotrichum fructicola]KAF4492362.1 hypothetical protein CGGC5_v002552 [Colletotrichum fructicola Nara gc5]KAE9568727.1 hypothetical protein CGMCC3_g15145 [Colletotrichum fructicola]KAF4432014.1 hypothetical protein CFRS1_v012538 [Colletotrichum fructicola]KAF4890255.1 hypothetical protein CGCFRS4_v008908 [Colletotrichum fructicola]KAF4898969.1 hypothetical protein CGCF415_v010604 [Colletotrichum fructicola]
MSQQEHQMSATDIRKSVRNLVTLRGSAHITIATQDSKFRQEAYEHTLNYLSDWADYHPNGFKEWYVENIDMLRHTEGFARPEGSLTGHKGIAVAFQKLDRLHRTAVPIIILIDRGRITCHVEVFLRSKDGIEFTKTTYVFILDLDSSCRFRRVEQRIIRETKFQMDELDKMLEDSKSRRIYQSF